MSGHPSWLIARTSSVEETRDLAAALAELARPSDLLVLVGDLGVGKTAFTQGFGRGLGVDEQITSPTFALVRSYTGRLDLYHLDVYRLEQVSETLDLGLSELLDDGAVTIIEWGDTIAPALPHDYLEVHLRFDVSEPDAEAGPDEGGEPDEGGDAAEDGEAADVTFEVHRRVVEMRPVGARWSARVRALGMATAPWIDDAPSQSPSDRGDQRDPQGGAPC